MLLPMRETSTERSRRHRWRKRHDIAAVTVNVNLSKLIAAGLLSGKHASKKTIAAAVENFICSEMSKQAAE
jgi:hypothetical protein